MPLTMDALKSARQWVEFQLLKPIGGVRASPSARAGAAGVSAGAARAGAARPAAHSRPAVSAPATLRRVVRVVRV